jgi:60 kDa SS-A/Ro ribonucleoprotein
MKNYSKTISSQGHQSPLPGYNMVKNDAGGYGFAVSPQERLERFLLIGSEGGTYYVSEQELTEKNAAEIIKMIQNNGEQVVRTVTNFAVNNRAPKADAGIFVLALATKFGNEETKQAAYSAISQVCKTSTHLFMFLANVKNLRGWSRGLRKGVAKFYTSRTPDQVAYQMAKYRNRAGYTHRDVLRLCHATPTNSEMNTLFQYAVGKTKDTTSSLINAAERAQTAETRELIGLIKV